VIELAPRGDEVLLLTHLRLPSRDELRSVSSGWHTHLGVLGNGCAASPPPFWPRIEKLEREYEKESARPPSPRIEPTTLKKTPCSS
jgi:hypothetical protein